MGSYFRYAIGEILLVVVGILLALQINNWNEGRGLFSSPLLWVTDPTAGIVQRLNN